MDMPPQQVVEYRVAPVKAEGRRDIASQVARFLGAERIRVEQKAGITIGSFHAARKLPPMDFSSPRLTSAERRGMALVLGASQKGRLGSTGVTMPDGYVARRIAAAIMTARIADRSQSGLDVTPRQIDAVRCRLVAVVMDVRAGEYVKGGERAAAASRAALTVGDVELCRPVLEAQAARISAARAPVGVSPAASAKRMAAVSVSPKGSERVRIDPVGSKRVSVMPTGSKGVPVAEAPDFARRVAMLSAKGGSSR